MPIALPKRLLLHVFLVAFSILMIYPVLWMISSSLKPASDIFSTASLWPSHWTFANYVQGWIGVQDVKFGSFLGHSFLVATLVVLGTVLSSPLVAFAFARLNFVLKRTLFAVMLVTMMLPSQVTLIPQYTLFHQLHWINTYLPLTVPAFLGGGPFFIFLLVQFIRGIPRELDESATIDGCNKFHIFLRIVMPLCSPALITTAIFSFLWTWDDFFGQLIYLNDTSMYTVPIGLRLFMDETGQSQWGPMFAMSVISLIPSFFIFVFFQKYLVNGISTSGLKG